MKNTREDSPYHREENVAVHTEMILSWYTNNIAHNRNDAQRLYTLFAVCFHDVGKPASETEKTTPERGTYRVYKGHEHMSARMWVNWAMEDLSSKDSILRCFNWGPVEVSNIAFMIEYHLPFDLGENKRVALKKSLLNRMGEAGEQAWLDMMFSDQMGRISDDASTKIERAETWINEWKVMKYDD